MVGIGIIHMQGAGQLPFQRPCDGLHLGEIAHPHDQAKGAEHLFAQGMIGQPAIARHFEQIGGGIPQVAEVVSTSSTPAQLAMRSRPAR